MGRVAPDSRPAVVRVSRPAPRNLPTRRLRFTGGQLAAFFSKPITTPSRRKISQSPNFSRLNRSMSASSHANCRPRPALTFSALATVLTIALSASLPARAQGTHLWTQSSLEEFEKGTPQGVALQSDGHLRQGPGLAEMLTTPSTFVWSVAVDKTGTAFLGTGSPATVLRVGKDGKPFTLFETKDVSVQVVRIGPDGSLYAATLPSGKVYRLKPDASRQTGRVQRHRRLRRRQAGPLQTPTRAKPNAPAKSDYIWDLTFDSAGRLYIAAGGPAAVYRIDPANPGSKPELFFKSRRSPHPLPRLGRERQSHRRLRRLRPRLPHQPRGQRLRALRSSSPRNHLRRRRRQRHHLCRQRRRQDPQSAAAAARAGRRHRHHHHRPARLAAGRQLQRLPARGNRDLRPRRRPGPAQVWSSKDDIVYALAARPDGLLALTGNRGHIFRIAERRQLRRRRPPRCPTGRSASPFPAGHRRAPHRHRQHRQALPASATRKARVRQRRPRRRRARPFRPRRSRARLLRLRALHPLRQCRAAPSAAGPNGSR